MSNTNLDMEKMLNMSRDELGNFLANLSDEKWALVLKRIPNNIKNAKQAKQKLTELRKEYKKNTDF